MGAAIFTEDQVDDSTLVISVEGELDISNASELGQRCGRAREDGISGIVIDFSRLDHMDSSGLAELLAIRAGTMERAGARLALALAGNRLHRVLELRGVVGLFTLAESRDEAIAAIRGGAAARG